MLDHAAGTDMTWPPRSADRRASAHAETVLAAEPGDIQSLVDRARLLDRLGDDGGARRAYLEVLAQDTTCAAALIGLGRLLARTGYTSAALTVFQQNVSARPEDPAGHVLLANMLRRAGRKEQAQREYAEAMRLAPGFPQAHQGMSHLLDGIDEAAAEHHRTLGFTGHALSSSPCRGDAPPLDVLRVVSARDGNIDLDGILDDRIYRVHTLVAEFASAGMKLPPHAVAFNAIGDADRCADALARVPGLLVGSPPVLNAPEKVLLTGRLAMSSRLAELEGVETARMASAPRAALQDGLPDGFCFPVLLRSPGYHSGEHFCRVQDRADLKATLADLPGETLLVIECLDSCGADGAFRKYRALFIGGDILPLHLAVSAEWKVHYFTARMAEEPAYRAEEARFLSNIEAALGKRATDCLARVGEMLGLDYGGVDFGLTADGRLMVFEANAAMVIATPPADAMWDYRRSAAQRCQDAARSLIRRKASQRTSIPGG